MASEILWRKLSDNEKKEIEKRAKNIMINFSKALEKIPGIKETFVEREKFDREEKGGVSCDNDFRKLMLKNAPSHDKDFIIAEKGKWI